MSAVPPILSTYTPSPVPSISRNAAIALSVVLLHVGFIYALYSGLLTRAVELVVPVMVLAQIIEPPVPKVAPPPPPPPPSQVKKPVTKAPTVAAPLPLAITDPTPAPNAPTGSTAPQPAPAPIAAPVAAAPVAATAPALTQKIEAPILDASYTANEDVFRKPTLSIRNRESGAILLAVGVGINGFATSVSLIKSSGFPRLDEAAIQGAKKLKFKPATKSGVPIEMLYTLPVTYLPEN